VVVGGRKRAVPLMTMVWMRPRAALSKNEAYFMGRVWLMVPVLRMKLPPGAVRALPVAAVVWDRTAAASETRKIPTMTVRTAPVK